MKFLVVWDLSEDFPEMGQCALYCATELTTKSAMDRLAIALEEITAREVTVIMKRDYSTHLRQFHEAKWDEEIIFDLSVPGQRGIAVTPPAEGVVAEVGNGVDDIPRFYAAKKAPSLPEVSQPRVNRHYMRLTQEILGMDVTPDISQGALHHEIQSQSSGTPGSSESQSGGCASFARRNYHSRHFRDL